MAFFIVFLLVTAGSLTGLKHEFRGDAVSEKTIVKADSTAINPNAISIRQSLPIGSFTGEEEKDNSSSLNSVNLIVYMIYKVTNKSVK